MGHFWPKFFSYSSKMDHFRPKFYIFIKIAHFDLNFSFWSKIGRFQPKFTIFIKKWVIFNREMAIWMFSSFAISCCRPPDMQSAALTLNGLKLKHIPQLVFDFQISLHFISFYGFSRWVFDAFYSPHMIPLIRFEHLNTLYTWHIYIDLVFCSLIQV